MDTFLAQVAKEILQSPFTLSEVKVVLPSQRAVRFLKKAFSEAIQQPVISPQILSITEFVTALSGLQAQPPLPLLFTFYESYQAVVSREEQESFDQFLHWAPTLLQDFNDLSAHRVPKDKIFSYLTEVEQLKEWARNDLQTPLTKNYIKFWKQMPRLHDHLITKLQEQKSGFLGMLFSEAVDNMTLYLEHTSDYHYLVGFNALTQSESLLIQEILSQGRGEILWDLDRVLYEDVDHASSRFIRSYFKSWKALMGQEPQWLGTHFSSSKKVQIAGATSAVQQVQYAAQLAQSLTQKYPDEKIALVLGDESYLIPALSAFDADFDQWNVTMGYPLIQTPAAELLVQWIDIHQAATEKRLALHAVEKLLLSASLQTYFRAQGWSMNTHLNNAKKRNRAFITLGELLDWCSDDLWHWLFTPLSHPSDLLERMHCFCIKLQSYFFTTAKDSLLGSYFYSMELMIQQIIEASKGKDILNKLVLIRVLINDALRQASLDFVGEATQGLQVMGLLETRLLDFDRVVITHLNEGNLPAGKTANTFLPFEVKKEFGVPTYHEKDAIFTYHFYRLLQRAQHVYLTYDASEAGLGGAAPSRFIYQLELFAPAAMQIERIQLQAPFGLAISNQIEVVKTESVMKKLHQIAAQGFSPSALTHYLRDPMAFYEERILGIKAPITADETVSYRDQGNVLHAVLEELYIPFQKSLLTEENIRLMLKDLKGVLQKHFEKIYGTSEDLEGRNYLIFQVLETYCKRFLKSEIKRIKTGQQIEILGLEVPFSIDLPVPGVNIPVKLRGTVDRIDRVDGQLRIVDYKTGEIAPKALSIELEGMDFDDPKTAVSFQVLTYAYQYLQQFPTQHITAGVIALKSIQSQLNLYWQDSNPGVLNRENIVHFETFLHRLILEILNPNIPFQRKIE